MNLVSQSIYNFHTGQTRAVVHKVSDLTLHYRLSEVVVHLQVKKMSAVLHSVLLAVV